MKTRNKIYFLDNLNNESKLTTDKYFNTIPEIVYQSLSDEEIKALENGSIIAFDDVEEVYKCEPKIITNFEKNQFKEK